MGKTPTHLTLSLTASFLPLSPCNFSRGEEGEDTRGLFHTVHSSPGPGDLLHPRHKPFGITVRLMKGNSPTCQQLFSPTPIWGPRARKLISTAPPQLTPPHPAAEGPGLGWPGLGYLSHIKTVSSGLCLSQDRQGCPWEERPQAVTARHVLQQPSRLPQMEARIWTRVGKQRCVPGGDGCELTSASGRCVCVGGL